jgi:hypothetical protein
MYRYQQQNGVWKKITKCSVNYHCIHRVSEDIKKQRREGVGIQMGISMGGCKKEYRRPYQFFLIKDPRWWHTVM